MKKIILSVVVFLIFSISWKSSFSVYKIDVKKSVVEYKGEKLTGYHNGGISIYNGFLKIENEKLVGGECYFDMNSINCWDIKNESKNKSFVNHLKNEDFFDVKKYPNAKFVINSVIYKDGNVCEIKGDLTLKNITKPVNFEANITVLKDKVSINTKDYFYINRTKWNIKYKSKSFFSNLKDKFIYDKVGVKLNIIAYK